MEEVAPQVDRKTLERKNRCLARLGSCGHSARQGRAKGYFIGSGVVEAGCRTIVGQRFKCAGMHWSLLGLTRLLSIRTAILSNRYEHFWAWRSAKLKSAA